MLHPRSYMETAYLTTYSLRVAGMVAIWTVADHQSHFAYPGALLAEKTQGGMCPESHPIAMINIGAQFWFSLEGIFDPHSLVFVNGDTTDYGFHGDFYMGWQDATALEESVADFFTNDYHPWRAFGSPTGRDHVATAMEPETAAPVEDVGLKGPIVKLPGYNPVYISSSSLASRYRGRRSQSRATRVGMYIDVD